MPPLDELGGHAAEGFLRAHGALTGGEDGQMDLAIL
jgi:hypothetical protein